MLGQTARIDVRLASLDAEFECCNDGYFSDFLYLNFCNLENPRNLSNSRAREIEPPRKSRELAKIASEPQSAAFGVRVGSEPSFGGARSRNGGFGGVKSSFL